MSGVWEEDEKSLQDDLVSYQIFPLKLYKLSRLSWGGIPAKLMAAAMSDITHISQLRTWGFCAVNDQGQIG
jgi:hypothetical protein